ncbi:J domain-containing protein [Devosia sp.]|uniref:J domain-containing protein n=1 Tax=Devosia sp. TaxID=1871048 RepID=UPI003A91608F
MKLDSKYFDSIRISKRRGDKPAADVKMCEWEGCDEPGAYKAPKGPGSPGQYHDFCLKHVRHYNQVFNFFDGMKPEEMDNHIKRAADTPGRPSWGTGSKPGADAGQEMPQHMRRNSNGKRNADPFGVFARYARHQSKVPEAERVKPLHEQDRRALEILGFSAYAKAEEIKSAYKALVKIHHPDANGGDRSSEDRLRAIITAYTHLKQKGFTGR